MTAHHLVGDSPFMKRVLLPFWIIRIIIMALYIAILAIALVVLSNYNDYLGNSGYSTIAIAIYAVMLVIILTCLVLDIVCIVKRSRRSLTPKLFLITNVVQTTIFSIIFGLDCANFSGRTSALSIIIALIIYLSFIGLLIYASLIFHRARKGTLTVVYGPANGQAELVEQNTAYPSHGNTAYDGAGFALQPTGVTPPYYDPAAAPAGNHLHGSPSIQTQPEKYAPNTYSHV